MFSEPGSAIQVLNLAFLKFEFGIVSSLKMRFEAPEPPRKLGPIPRSRLKFGHVLACWTRTARNRRVKEVRWSVTGPLSAAFARDTRVGDSDFGEANPRFLEMAT